jgi:endoglucanase
MRSLGMSLDHDLLAPSTMNRSLASTLTLVVMLASAGAHGAETTIRVSSLGFRPGSRKTATFLKGGRFTVRRADGEAVFSASLDTPVADSVSGQTVYVGDFSSVETPGEYYLELASCERSPTFSIAPDVYLDAYRTMMLGFYGQRCGTAVALSFGGASFAHGVCHEASVDLSYFDGTGQAPTLVGGWHDAGDYGRYTVNGGLTLGFMLRAWEDFSATLGAVALAIPESGGPTPDFLAETRRQVEWLLAMEYTDGSGRFSNAVKSPVFPPLAVMPEADTSPIALASASTMGTAVAAAALAEAARVYQPYDAAFAERCQQAAARAYAWVTATPGIVTPSEDWAAAYDYNDAPGDATEVALDATARIWAAAEIWATTGDSAALADFESRVQAPSYAFNPEPDWNDPADLGVITYLLADSPARAPAVVALLDASVMTAASALQSAYAAPDNGWGRVQGYWWGANGAVARSCLVFNMAARLDATAGWMDLCAEQIGHLMGRNLYGRSQVTGIGVDPPLHPHHRPSIADDVVPPWHGLLVGGAQQNGTQWIDWTDDENDYMTNESAINYNAGLVYAFAALLGPDPGQATGDGGVAPALDAGAPACASVVDAGTDGGGRDADASATHGGMTGGQGGCGCAVGRAPPAVPAALLAGLALLVRVRRRRRR